MARVYKQPSIVSGLSIQDIMDMDIYDFNKLNLKDLRQITGRLVSAANKRLRTFETRNEQSPATRQAQRSGRAFSTKNKNLNALRSEFVRAKIFLQSKTSTIRGWKQVKKDTISKLKDVGVILSEEQFDKFWKSYERLKEISPEVAGKNLKYIILKEISDMIIENPSIDIDEIVNKMNKRITEIYEEQAMGGNDGVSSFFNINWNI